MADTKIHHEHSDALTLGEDGIELRLEPRHVVLVGAAGQVVLYESSAPKGFDDDAVHFLQRMADLFTSGAKLLHKRECDRG